MSRPSPPPNPSRADDTPPAPPPHAPEIGRIGRLAGRFHFSGAIWFRLQRWGMVSMRPWLIRPAMLLSTTVFFLFLRGIAKALGANLEPVLGPAGWLERQRRAWRTLRSQAWTASERFERLETERPFRVEVEGTEHWYGVADGTERGFVLVTAHVGSWDVSSFVPSLMAERHVHVVREQEMDPEAQEFVEGLYRERGAGHFTTHFARDNPRLGATLLAALRRGDVVGLQGDRPSTTGRKVETALFGRPFVLPVGPAALARAAESPLLPVFCFREGRRRYRLIIRPPIHPPRTEDREGDLAATMQGIVSEVEWAIRRAPHQWYCFRHLWPD